MQETPSSDPISTKLERIAKLARSARGTALSTLAHYIDLDWLREAHRRTRKSGASGVDGQTADEYAAKLDDNLRSLLDRAKSGEYRALPVRRVYIPKGGSKTEKRPIGIPTFEDKVLQRAVAMVLEAICETEFVAGSYGFRPGRSAHHALDALRDGLIRTAGGWVLEIDVKKYFDTIDHGHLRQFVRRRIRDGVILRLIDKWLNAGVMEDGIVSVPETGSPQGGVVSPVLSNIFLHEVLDLWFENEVRPRMRGRAFLIRYADDATLVFEKELDARRVLAVLPKRFGKFGLTLHPVKTRLIQFRRPDRIKPQRSGGLSGRGSFDLLGFTHYWARSRKGKWVMKSKTACDRLSRAIKNAAEWCRSNRHLPVVEQWRMLQQKLRGHFGYFGITGNYEALRCYWRGVRRAWRKWLARRSQKTRLTWVQMDRLMARFPLLLPRIMRAPSTT